MMKTEYFGKGDSVNVEYRDGDMFTHDFTGTVKAIRNDNIIVEDQDGDCWEVEADQVSFCSDEHFRWLSEKSW